MLSLRDADDIDLASSVALYVDRPMYPRVSMPQAIVRHSLYSLRGLSPPAMHDRLLRAGNEIAYDRSFHRRSNHAFPNAIRPGVTRYYYHHSAPVPRDAVALWLNEASYGRYPPTILIVRPMVWALQCARVNTFPDTRTPAGGPAVDSVNGHRYIPMIVQTLPL